MSKYAPLNGIKIAGFTWVGVGPHGIKYLSTQGATVIRIESHRRIDPMRRSSPYEGGVPNVDKAPWFPQANLSVFGVSIDLNKPSGLDIAWRIIRWADVLSESFTPGTMQKWGLDYSSVSKKRPDIIYLSTCQMGQTGPLAKIGGFGFHASATSGISHLTGWPDRAPTPHATAFVDPIGARFVAISILAALEYRRRSGRGQYIDLSQCEIAIQHIAPAVMDYGVNGRSMIRSGNSLPYAAPHNVYLCRGDDRWCAIAVFNDEQWKGFCNVINLDWVKESKFSSLLLRKQNEAELDKYVSEWTINHSAEDVETRMQKTGVPCHIVSNIKDVFDDPQLKHRGFFHKLKHSIMHEHSYYAAGFKLSKTEGIWRAGPALGEHNEYVLKGLLGMTDDEIANALIEGGITTDADLPK